MSFFGSTDFNLQIQRGVIPGFSAISKFGENPDIDSASGFETVWDAGGVYVPPTTARIHDVASDNAADTGTILSSGTATGGSLTTLEDTGATFIADGVSFGDIVLNDNKTEIGLVTSITSETIVSIAGSMRSPWTGSFGSSIITGDSYRIVTNASTGGSILTIEGLDVNRFLQDEFVALNGITPVSTAKSYARQFRARIFGPNTSGAIGTVASTAQTDGTISTQVINGNNQSLMAVFSIPVGKTGYMTKWWAALSNKISSVSTVRLRAGSLAGIGYILQTRSLSSDGSSSFDYSPLTPLKLVGGVDIWVEADAGTNNLGVASGFDLTLEDD